MFVVTVDFQIHAAQLDAFMESMLSNAKASVDLEEGCLQFDVCVAQNDNCHVFLYEVYRKAEDFDVHLKTAHFLSFNAESAAHIASKTVRMFQRAGA
jgi:(4S)-4-hydroxy-5-phosphonooxypentane-2,3-dione isomerase